MAGESLGQTYLTTKEVAARIAMSVDNVRRLIDAGAFPGATQDYDRGPWRIPSDAVDTWIATHPTVRPSTRWDVRAVVALLGRFWAVVVGLGIVAALLADSGGAIDWIRAWRDNLSPEPLPPGASFNVVVAGFGLEQPDETIIRDQVADEISDLVYSSLEELRDDHHVDSILGWRATGVGRILDSKVEDRQERAAQMAAVLNADLVIYGVVRNEGYFVVVRPEFYLKPVHKALEPELVDSGVLGSPVTIFRDSDEVNADFQLRIAVIRQFIRGLEAYFYGDFAKSREVFEQAIAAGGDGFEVLYILAGNAALREQNLVKALEFFDTVLQRRPDYARALVGRAIALFLMATPETSREEPTFVLMSEERPGFTFDPAVTLPENTTCTQTPDGVPDSPQLLALLALDCYQRADESIDRPQTADLDVKTAFGVGQVNLWLSLAGANGWDAAERSLLQVIDLYERFPVPRQDRIRYAAANAHAWLGLLYLKRDEGHLSVATVQEALRRYRLAVQLLQEGVDRGYDEEFLKLYRSQIKLLETWLAADPIEQGPKKGKE